MPKYLCSLLAFFLVLACGEREPGADLSRIIGDNDLRPVDANFGMSQVVNAIGRLRVGCTVTHVGNGVVVTAGHCFYDSPFERRIENATCDDSKFEVEWGVLSGTPSYLTSRCTEVISAEYRGGVDYTIFRVEPAPDYALRVSDSPARRGERISIFSHPRRRPLEWSGFCDIKSLASFSESQFGYECDTDGGSSGAAILNERYEIVGIHNFYNSMENLNGGTSVNKTPLARIARSSS